MKLELYQRKDEEIWCTINAELSAGRLSISGHDLGPQVKLFFPDGEYEYSVSLTEENTRKLFESLGCADETDEKKLHVIKDSFENSRADSALKEYCAEHGIETSFWCWP